jgi:hypothetical protein
MLPAECRLRLGFQERTKREAVERPYQFLCFGGERLWRLGPVEAYPCLALTDPPRPSPPQSAVAGCLLDERAHPIPDRKSRGAFQFYTESEYPRGLRTPAGLLTRLRRHEDR